jgi:hypothetical protein
VLDSWLRGRLESGRIKIEPKVVPIEIQAVREIFPDDDFYGVYFPRWPRAIPPPEGLSFETIVCLRKHNSVEVIRGTDELRMFLAEALTGVTDETKARVIVQASLILAAFSSQNGPYELKEPQVSIVRESKGMTATAEAAVNEPARGDIKVTIEFNAAGSTNPDAVRITTSTHSGPPSL